MSKYGSTPEKKSIITYIWIAVFCLLSSKVNAWQNPYEDMQLMQYMYGASNPYSMNPYGYSPSYSNRGSRYPQTMGEFSPWDRSRFNPYMNRPSPNWKVRGGIDERGNISFVMEYKGNIYSGGNTNRYYPGSAGYR